ncbi:MAG TPA: hypothetical protein DHW78_01550 [Ruminococcaceae bacterium]|nr:hypothetical protein [Oscillospiraceae bacterium]HCM23001.1 hypothetical protein [Oscillospiraceae bacterium]
MSMRITDRSSTRNYLRYLNNALYNQQNTMDQIQSGYRFKKVSDDVSDGVKNMRTKAEKYKADVCKDNVDSIKDKLDTVDSTMTNIHDLFTNMDAMLEKAVTGTSSSQRQVYAQEADSTKSQVLQLLNTQYDNQYLFGGSNNYTAPFTVSSETGELEYNNIPVSDIQQRDDGSYFYLDANNQPTEVPMNEKTYMNIGLDFRMNGANADPSSGFDVSYSGADLLGFGKTADGKQNNLFNVLNEITQTLGNSTVSTTEADSQKLSSLGTQLQTLNNRFLTQVTEVGSKDKFLSTLSDHLETTSDTLNEKMSSLVGTNTAEASTEEATDVAVTNALYRLGSSVIPTSLMDFIK